MNKQGKALHEEINSLIQRKQSEIEDMDRQHLAAITTQEDLINKKIHEIKQVIFDLQKLLESDDVCLISEYTSRNEEFRSLPAQFQMTRPASNPQEINREQLSQQLGSLSQLLITYPIIDEPAWTTKENCSIKKTHVDLSSSPAMQLSDKSFSDKLRIDTPSILIDLKTTGYNRLFNVSCLTDEKIWISGDTDTMYLLNLQGEILKSVQTISKHSPEDIAVTQNGGLVYADSMDSSVSQVNGTQTQTRVKPLGRKSKPKIQTLITLKHWVPRGLCNTSSGDLLIIMTSDDRRQTKIVRYSGSKETQIIQKDNKGNALYSSGYFKYLSENSNLDICVADNDAGAVVVVSAAGKFRFRYTGPSSSPRESFYPYSITTDSKGNILTSDLGNDRIHIIDQDGLFLRLIDSCDLQRPWGLCVDSRDNLFVAEYSTGKVKKLQYYK